MSYLWSVEALKMQALCVWFYKFGVGRAQQTLILPEIPAAYFWDSTTSTRARKRIIAVYKDLTVVKFRPRDKGMQFHNWISCQMSIGRIFQA